MRGKGGLEIVLLLVVMMVMVELLVVVVMMEERICALVKIQIQGSVLIDIGKESASSFFLVICQL